MSLTSFHMLDHRRFVGPRDDLWENNGWGVIGRGDGTYFLLWVSPYIVISNGKRFFNKDLSHLQLMYMEVPWDIKEGTAIMDNDFVSLGWTTNSQIERQEIRVSSRDGGVEWEVGGALFSAAPPTWRLRYGGAPLSYDISLEATGQPMWFSSPDEESFKKTGRLSYSVYARANGELAIDGRKSRIEGYGFHEHASYLNFDMAKTFYSGEGLKWHNGFSDELKFFAFKEATKRTLGWIIHRDKVIECDSVLIEESSWWDDPRSTMHIPSSWIVYMSSGTRTSLVVKSRAYARAYYYWDFMKQGYAVLYWYLCRGDGVFVSPDGSKVTVNDMQYVVHTNRLI